MRSNDRNRRIAAPAGIACICVLLALILSDARKPRAYDAQYLDLFDTITSVTIYAESETAFQEQVRRFHDEMENYHRLYDIYHTYEGMNNLKTVNDQAGIAPVKVDQRIIDLLKFSKEMERMTDGKVNVAMGGVLSIWHGYREAGLQDPDHAALPSLEELREAAAHTDIDQVVIDESGSTVYLPDSRMSLDVGAVAKGYAAERAGELLEQSGVESALLNVGGNIRTIGRKGDGASWNVGVQNPDLTGGNRYLFSIHLNGGSLVTSGTYQRYYTVDGKNYHHIIDPATLMPADRYQSVSILCRDSGMADALSTSVFNMDLDTGRELIGGIEGAEALWVLPDGSRISTDGFEKGL